MPIGIGLFLLLAAVQIICSNAKTEMPPLYMTELAEYFGYPYENHTITTKDGYTLTNGRLPGPKEAGSCDGHRGVVLLDHGAFDNGEQFMSYNRSLAYQLADNCFDVWILNIRGTRYSDRHKKYPVTDRQFWAYGQEEIALNDLKAFVDYIRQQTGRDKLHFVCFSQGCTQFWMLATLEPTYQKYFESAQMIAPVFSMDDADYWEKKFSFFSKACTIPELAERPYPIAHNLIFDLVHEACHKHVKPFSRYLVEKFRTSKDVFEEITYRFPDAVSLRQMCSMSQLRGGPQRRYDFGAKKNKELYGTPVPPAYKLSSIEVPISIYNSKGDSTSSPKDVQKFATNLHTLKNMYTIDDVDFSHDHFVLGKSAEDMKINAMIVNECKAS